MGGFPSLAQLSLIQAHHDSLGTTLTSSSGQMVLPLAHLAMRGPRDAHASHVQWGGHGSKSFPFPGTWLSAHLLLAPERPHKAQ